MAAEPPVLLESTGRVAWLVLNRPESRNALNRGTIHALRETLARLREDGEIWAVAVTGAGERAFCAGADLKERRTMNEEQVQDFVASIRGLMDDLASLPQPTVAVMNGAAYGGGLEMALACDLRILDESASVGLTETSLAILPGAGGCARLPRLIGLARAKELILLARRVPAREALEMGLIHRLAPAGGARAAGQALLEELLRNGPLALRAAKRALEAAVDLPLAEALQFEQVCYRSIIPTEDRLEALRAFAEKRPPRFQGR